MVQGFLLLSSAEAHLLECMPSGFKIFKRGIIVIINQDLLLIVADKGLNFLERWSKLIKIQFINLIDTRLHEALLLALIQFLVKRLKLRRLLYIVAAFTDAAII